jgi:hypothetical protein
MYISKYTLLDYLYKDKYNSVRDLVRHEYAHGFAHHYYDLIEIKAFEKAFGGTYDSKNKTKMPTSAYFTDYAKSILENSQEFLSFPKKSREIPRNPSTYTFVQLISMFLDVTAVIFLFCL